MNRPSTAAEGRDRATTGRTALDSPAWRPATGNIRKWTEKTMIRSNASQKPGIDAPASDTTRTTWSISRFR